MYPNRMGFAVMLSLILMGCGESTTSVNSVAPGSVRNVSPSVNAKTIRVSLIMKTLTNPFFVEMEKGARKAQQESGVELQVLTASQETSIEQQVQIVENQIEAKVDAIVIAPGDSQRLISVLKKAQDAGIKVVNIDNRLLPTEMEKVGMKPVPFISVDNEKAAYMSAKYLADQISLPTDVAIIEGIRNADNSNQRKHGAERAFKENRKLRLVAMETANWKIDEAYNIAGHVLTEHPKLGAVFCANDMMALGFIKYLQETKRSNVLVGGFDALEDAKVAVHHGLLQVTVDQQAAQQGYVGVMTALKLLKGESVPQEVLVDARLVTAKDLK